jgi:hypothetical protein
MGAPIVTGMDTCYTAVANGDYTVNCTSSSGCVSDDSAPETVSGIGLVENEISQAISISPNPTSGLLTVHFEGLNAELVISLRDVNGRILETKTGSTFIEFDLGHFETGVYLIDCEHHNQRIVKRIVRD